MAPTTDTNLNGDELSPRSRYQQEFDDFDLFQTKKPKAKYEAPPISSLKVTTPGATGNTPSTSQENFNMSNMIKTKPIAKPMSKIVKA